MTKQEEIREVVDRILYEAIGDDEGVITQQILGCLNKMGVVIKVDRELPILENDYEEAVIFGWNKCKIRMKKDGYVAVEPLIK